MRVAGALCDAEVSLFRSLFTIPCHENASLSLRARTGDSMRLFAATLIAAAMFPTKLHAACTEPGKARWAIKSSLQDDRLELHPREVALPELIALHDARDVKHNDARYNSSRIATPANDGGLKEGDVVATEGWLHLVALEDNDCEYHIQLSKSATDGDKCLIVEVAKDDAVSIHDADLRARAGDVRAFVRDRLLKGREPSGSGSIMQHPVYVRVVGQLFYDDAHVGDDPRGKRGMKAATLWELHPIVSMEFARPPR